MAPFFLEVDGMQYEVTQYRLESATREYHLVVSRAIAMEIKGSLGKAAPLHGALKEEVQGTGLPVPDLHEIFVVDAIPDDTFDDAHHPKGGELVALSSAGEVERWYHRNGRTPVAGSSP
jgi:hypothetical protein